jgi:hypothetical protein
MCDIDSIGMDIGAGLFAITTPVAFFRIKRDGIITFSHSIAPLIIDPKMKFSGFKCLVSGFSH